jgi:hypothetical protein
MYGKGMISTRPSYQGSRDRIEIPKPSHGRKHAAGRISSFKELLGDWDG